MTTEQKIPDDVMKAAREVYDAGLENGFRAATIRIIARAILAERQAREDEIRQLRDENGALLDLVARAQQLIPDRFTSWHNFAASILTGDAS